MKNRVPFVREQFFEIKKQFNRNIINKMDSKICVVCNTEKSIDSFHKNYRECKPCNIERNLKRYNENKDKISNNQKIYFAKNRDRLLHKQKDKYMNFKGLHRPYVEL